MLHELYLPLGYFLNYGKLLLINVYFLSYTNTSNFCLYFPQTKTYVGESVMKITKQAKRLNYAALIAPWIMGHNHDAKTELYKFSVNLHIFILWIFTLCCSMNYTY